jgi:hypothetical protein
LTARGARGGCRGVNVRSASKTWEDRMNRREFDERTLRDALSLATQQTEPAEDRLHMAEIAAFILRRGEANERTVTDAVNALGQVLDQPDIARVLLRAVPAAAPDPSRLALGLARLARQACRAGHDEILIALALTMLRNPAWAQAVEEPWAQRAFERCMQPPARCLRKATLLLERWIQSRGGRTKWVLHAVNEVGAAMCDRTDWDDASRVVFARRYVELVEKAVS